MSALRILLPLGLLLVFPFSLFAAPYPIVIDGRVDDWEDISPLFQQESDKTSLDVTGLWVVDDAEYLFLRIDLNQEILLQENNGLVLYLDIDGKGATGDLAGAEIAYSFGERKGWIQHDGESLPIEYEALDLYTLPSTMASSFEISISWEAHPWLDKIGFGDHRLGVMLFNKRTKDILCYAYCEPMREARAPVRISTLERAEPEHLRLVTHNVNRRNFHPDKRDAFSRIYEALDPDILILEEAYEGSAEEILDYFRPALGGAPDWHAYKAGAEATVVLSPFTAKQVVPLGNSAAYLLDLRPSYESDLALIVLSMPCCRADSSRQAEADQIAAFIREWKKYDLPHETPIVLAGDANLVGFQEQYLSLLEGKIQDGATHGSSQLPDWDNTALTDLCPRQLQRPMATTWRGKGFSPSRLDYILYSDSVLKVGRRFVFDTAGLPAPFLQRYQLKEEDAMKTYKHMPVVADLILK